MLEVDNVSISYGKTSAVSDVSLTVEEGEIVGIIGPNGAGKTTLLDAISGFKGYEGSIRFGGEEIRGLTEQEIVQRGLVYCTEDRDLFPFFSVHENLLMGAQFREDRDAVQEDLEFVYDLFPRLDERRDQHAETMSGGEQQMLAVGRSLMSDPDLLMLDEPTLGLAPVIIEDIKEAIERLSDAGLTILLAEQNSTFALDHAERLCLLERGEITRQGDAETLKNDDYVRDAYIGVV
ncbi:ABC-type transport system ATP-binding protein (probable substrate branched-chain amino acids) [Natronomonas pharaonis DSM 2160]|uniref:ABC-type transport system ATP-binding protein (Probable substrate branched-chain amino acids) n=1 Tax=Natronomonas pharaonis (strain ATCC 35678 / DSM 2160 / CIP 103997 / JCM 8858 / NBRC 14720 / NCIMB 2260 / Gabara) TaxID=348780 RepID=A0A1U7EUZ2_NATPD|nr:ABC transporter ATP-binding protein [Natronomonas pharaonis]CAI48827.1 ABC-type transport system ATP-binding protein (probable substrate branched-chain amino acids) [Natronomonas pharaonis DSM 2160]